MAVNEQGEPARGERTATPQVLRVWVLGPLAIEWAEGSFPPERMCGRGSARALGVLKALLSQADRFATRDWLMEQFWPDSAISSAQERLDDVASGLRTLLRPPGSSANFLHYVHGSDGKGSGYRLEGYPRLWVDADAFCWLVEQAARLDRFGQDSLPVWEQAYHLGARGPFLPEERYSDWAQARRELLAGHYRQCVHRLAAILRERGASEQALLRLRTYWQAHLTDEDVLRPLMELLGEQERYQEAEDAYQQLEHALTEDGHPCDPDERTRDLREYLRTKQLRRERIELSTTNRATQPATRDQSIYLPESLPVPSAPLLLPGQGHDLSPDFSHAVTQGIIETARDLEGSTMDQLRRQILEQALKVTGVAIFTSPERVLSTELGERLTKALTSPSHIDEKTLLYLEKRMGTYWQDRNDVAMPAWNLLPYVQEDLHKVTTLLEGSLQPTTRTRLCSIAGIAAMLVGELYYDMRDYAQARMFQNIAIEAAHEANNTALEAVAWGRNSFAWTYDGNPHEARESIQHARHLVWSVNSTVRSWLAAVEAEIQSNLGEREGCLRALNEAAPIENQKHHQRDCYWIHFDQALFAGYQGASFLKLSNLGHKDLVRPAQTVLHDALDMLDPAMKRRQPTLLVDLAGTYVHQENIEQACAYAIRAIDSATHIYSKVLFQRLLTLRSTLERWKETPDVQEFDGSIEQLLMAGRE